MDGARRFSSLKFAPAETRRILRDRFARYLPVAQQATLPVVGDLISDEHLLNLLLNLDILFGSDVDRARANYDAALPQDGGEPSFDDAKAAGWFRVVWGRIAAPFENDERARAAPDGTVTALATMFKGRFEEQYAFRELVRENADLKDFVAAIERGDLQPNSRCCRTPEWVAARLWDRALSDSGSHGAELRVWIDRWRLLNWPSVTAHKVWSEAAANAFRETALLLLENEPGLTGWEETREGFIRQISLRTDQPTDVAGRYTPALPNTLLDRAIWLNDLRLEGAIAGMMAANGDLVGLIRLLLTDIEEQELSPIPNPIFKRLMDFAVERPEILVVVLFRVRWSPKLLADLLLHPATSALACWLINEWPGQSGAYDQELRAKDDKITKAMAFGDAMAVVGSFLEQGKLPPAEAASLAGVIYRKSKPLFGEEAAADASILAILRDEIMAQPVEIQKAVFEALANSGAAQSGLGSAEFSAALDIVDAADLTERVDPALLVSAYSKSVAASAYGLSANRISESAAASLVKLAMKAPEDIRQSFLAPVDVRSRIAAAAAPDANPYIVEDETARSLRAHIRVLSRAVAGFGNSSPPELKSALLETVRVGAVKHDEKGRVGAFAARFETDPYRGSRDRPIAADLAAALKALPDDEEERLLRAILETDEPLVLAQLIGLAPQALRAQIAARLNSLEPSDAAATRSLPEAMGRIEALLGADQPEVAAKFIETERGLKTFGKVPGRELARFRIELYLKLLRQDWNGIAQTAPPEEFSGQEREAALDIIGFFKGLAALRNPDGSAEAAENWFASLQQKHPGVAGYGVNLLAARIAQLLGGDLFGHLEGDDVGRGSKALREAEASVLRARNLTASDKETFDCNKAVLLLALGRPAEANEVLAATVPVRLSDRIAAYTAVALARMGRSPESSNVLRDAENLSGKTQTLQAAQEHITTGKSFPAAHAADDTLTGRIQQVLFQVRHMDPAQQAEVYVGEPDPVKLMTKLVRTASGRITSLAPMMTDVIIDDCEDDLSAHLREFLSAEVSQLSNLGWTVQDQSKGGWTAKGNPGERDFRIEKDGATLAILEALVCSRPVNQETMRKDFANHFQRLFAYDHCTIFFHLTYAYLEKTAEVNAYLKQMAETEAPLAFKFSQIHDIPKTDSLPPGFIAEYEGEHGPVKVVFLLLDMQQEAQREAAKMAAATKSG